MLISIFLSLIVSDVYAAKQTETEQYYRHQINSFYLQDKEALVDDKVISVAQYIVNERQNFSDDVIAKAFSLLSYIAGTRGDTVAALQFAQYGIAIKDISSLTTLDLLLKVADGYYIQGNYLKLKDISQELIMLAEHQDNRNYHLHGIAYSIVAHALSAEYVVAIAELGRVEALLNQDQQGIDQISLLEIIAEAHFNLSEYENTIELLSRVIVLRFEMVKMKGIFRSYYLLARAYYQKEKYDDAYNAFWEAKQYAEKTSSPIQIAYAELGLGQVLFQQDKLFIANTQLYSANRVFKKNNLFSATLSTQIMLIQVLQALNKHDEADDVLKTAEQLADQITLSSQQIEIYALLVRYYKKQNLPMKVIEMQERYLSLYQRMHPAVGVDNLAKINALTTRKRSKNIALSLAEQSELSLRFNNKFKEQQIFIILLSVLLTFALLLLCYWRWKFYRHRRGNGYDEIEAPINQLSTPVQTKNWYQTQYKSARKYQYKISIGYLVIDNWQELNFHCNNKALTEVTNAIATIINENFDEEDYSGVISEGEYLLLCPHQDSSKLDDKVGHIEQAINARVFANLGDYSVNISFISGSPTIQDIDPYVFLSQLSENIRVDIPYNNIG